MFSWIWNLRNCVLQTGSVRTVYLGGAENTIAKNVWVVRGGERSHGKVTSWKFVTLHTVPLLRFVAFCTFEHAALKSLHTGCVYTAFLRCFGLHLVVAFWASIWVPKWVYPKPNKGWEAARGFLLSSGWSWSGVEGVLSHRAEWQWKWSGMKLGITFLV